MSENKYELVIKLNCNKCHKDYGKTNMSYNGCELWVACDCHPANLAVFVDPNKLDLGMNTPGIEVIPTGEIQ